MTSASSREQLLQALRRQVERMEEQSRPREQTAFSTGCAALDGLLPQRGLLPGTLVEWLAAGAGSGVGTLALLAAREACRRGGAFVVLEGEPRFYPPAAALWGVDLEQVVVVRAAQESDSLWAFDQALRCPAVAAVWGQADRLRARDFRRLQLAAESGGTLGLLLRPARARGQPSWADVQLLVEPRASTAGRRLRVEVTRCRGGVGGRAMELEIDEATGVVREVNQHATHPLSATTELARAAAVRRSAGA